MSELASALGAKLDIYRIGSLPEPNSARFGAKAIWLDRLVRLGIAVPDAVVIPLGCYWLWCRGLVDCRQLASAALEVFTSFSAGQQALYSVRSGAILSMPGALSTELNVGADAALMRQCWHEAPTFWKQVATETARRSAFHLADSDTIDAAVLTSRFDPPTLTEQVATAMEVVFHSSRYNSGVGRAHLGLTVDLGTSCIVQKMVHGNYDNESAAGVMSTCNPVSGAAGPNGAFIRCGLGKEIVDGERADELPIEALRDSLPEPFYELCAAGAMLERIEKCPIELEFVVERGKLWLLQARRASLSGHAFAKWLVHKELEWNLSQQEVAKRWIPSRRSGAPQGEVSDKSPRKASQVFQGTAISGGIVTGQLVWAGGGDEVIANGAIVALDRLDPARDLGIIERAGGLITARGGISSHAAAVCRKLDKPYVSSVPWAARSEGSPVPDAPFAAGDLVWISGSEGKIGGSLLPYSPTESGAENLLLDTLAAEYCVRSWFLAHNKCDRAVENLLALGRSRVCNAKWRTEKACLVELQNLVPLERRIAAIVVAADDEVGLQRVMLDGIRAGYSLGPKCACRGKPRLGSGNWQFDLTSMEQVDAFLRDPNFLGPSGRGGYKLWASDADLSEIIVMLDPPQKRKDVPADQRFIASMSISANKQEVIIEILPNTWRLRDFDTMRETDAVRISARLENLRAGDRYAIAQFGQALQESSCQYTASVLLPFNNVFRVVDPAIESQISPKAAALAALVTERLLGDWWMADQGLPVLMDVFERIAGFDAMEFQGRIGSGKEDFFLMFDLKGGEEARAITHREVADVR